jgi:protein tyrosine kinase modulator
LSFPDGNPAQRNSRHSDRVATIDKITMQAETTTLRDYLYLLKRRRGAIFVVFSVMAISIVGGTFLLDDQYRSTAILGIERPEIPENMVRTTVTKYDTDLRIRRDTAAVLTKANIEGWISEYGLYPDIVANLSMSEAVKEFAADVEILTIQQDEDVTTKDQGDTVAFEVSYYGQNPEHAFLVANALANQFIEENRRSRNQSVEETLGFFKREADRIRLRIKDAEVKLADFKEKNSGAMPESSSVNLQMLERTERDLENIERELRDLREGKQLLQAELADVSPYSVVYSASGETMLAGTDRLKVLEREYIQLSSRYGPEHPDVVRARRELVKLRGSSGGREIATVQTELEASRRELASLQDRYTDDHPDVRELARRVELLEYEYIELQQQPLVGQLSEPDNPEYIQLQVRIRAADEDLAALGTRRRELRVRIGEYEDRMLMAPQVEREFLTITRDYDQAIKEYNDIREKQTDAQRARQLEFADKGERYVMQIRPDEPTVAAFPNRIAIIVLGIIFAAGAGLGTAVVAEALDSTVRSVRDLRTLTGMPPIVVVPVLQSHAERRNRNILWFGSIFLVTGLLVSLISIQLT